jgi:2-oxoisovalerate dehydrogenase E2 component (dihydrolipoyl transacylase)
VGTHVIKVPDIGEGIAEVELVAWHVKPGDVVAEDQALADVMTDKATVEIPSPVAGRVVGLGGEVGQVLAVGSELIRIEAASPAGRAAPPQAPAAAAAANRASAPPGELARPAPRSPAAQAPAGERPIASPAIRARAWELGVDLKDVRGSGPAGRIMRADLEAHAAVAATRAGPAAPRGPAERAPAGKPAVQAPAGKPPEPGTHEVKIVGLRRKIAQRMQESKRRIAHYTYVEEVDVTELEVLRSQLNEKWGSQRGHLTLLPFLIRAIVLAVREFPQVNARFDDEAGVLTQYDAVHVGIATQTDQGLMVPVLRDAQARDLWSSAAEVARLAQAARSGKAVRDELSGSTLTITSLGRLGGIMSTPVINHPEVAIVGVNRIALRPVMLDGAVVARQLMNLSSSFDHRVIDGALAAGFVQRLRSDLEHPAALVSA